MTLALPQTFDLFNSGAQIAEPSTDRAYLRREFVTTAGSYHVSNGWTPSEARLAIDFHLQGNFARSAVLAVDVGQYPPIMGALRQRMAPALRAKWTIEGPDRAPGRFAADDAKAAWKKIRRLYRSILRDIALMGFSITHVHTVTDPKTGLDVQRYKRWPLEAVFWRGWSPAWAEGYYAMTIADGFVRIVHGDGHWIIWGDPDRPHELGAILALAESYVRGVVAGRDRAGLSEAAGRAAPVLTLPEGVKADDPQGIEAGKVVAGLGRARKGAVIPFKATIAPFQITSDTDFFSKAFEDELKLVALALLGQTGTLAQGSGGVYASPMFQGVAEALVDSDIESTERGFLEGVSMPLLAANYPEVDAEDAPELTNDRPSSDADAKFKSDSGAAQGLALTVKMQRDAGLEPTQDDVNALAKLLGTAPITIGEKKEPVGPQGALVSTNADGTVDGKPTATPVVVTPGAPAPAPKAAATPIDGAPNQQSRVNENRID